MSRLNHVTGSVQAPPFMAITLHSLATPLLGFAIACIFQVAVAASSDNLPRPSLELAQTIDERLAEMRKAARIEPAALMTDAEFLRRVFLDVAGHIPTVSEVKMFLADSSPDKREKIIASLLASDSHNRHMATFWRRTWIPQADTPLFADRAQLLEQWIHEHLRKDAGYDAIAYQLLTAVDSRSSRENRSAPSSLFDVTRNQPEELAANNMRAFVGINIRCAQCHDDPLSAWTQKQFWESAAFYVPAPSGNVSDLRHLSIAVPDSSQQVSANFLTPYQVKLSTKIELHTGPQLIAQWMIEPKNPFFARNAVNLVWKRYLGEALVANLTDSEGSTQKELLDEIAASFIASGFNLRYLSQAILETKTYQLSSRSPNKSPPASASNLFSVAPVRSLTGEQFFASLRLAAGYAPLRSDVGSSQELASRDKFLMDFYVEDPVQSQRSMLQSLQIMNGETSGELTDPLKSPLLLAISQSSFLSLADKVNTLFLAALGRYPDPDELNWVLMQLEEAKHAQTFEKDLANVFWALIATSEFSSNH